MIYIIVNEKARTGQKNSTFSRAIAYLKEKEISYKAWKTEGKGHATKLVRQIEERFEGMIYLVVIGGDGTVNEVINGISDFDRVCLGVIPNGSGNDFARGVGMAGSVEHQIRNIVEATALNPESLVKMDLGKVEYKDGSRIFGISSGIGLDAIVCKRAFFSKVKKWTNLLHMGNLTYVLLTIHSLFSMETVESEVILDEKAPVVRKRMIFCAAMNLRSEGGGVPMAPHQTPDSGQLDLCMSYGISKRKAFLCLPVLMMGKHEYIRGFEVVPFQKCRIMGKTPQVLHLDGEYCGEVTDISISCMKEKLRVLKRVKA